MATISKCICGGDGNRTRENGAVGGAVGNRVSRERREGKWCREGKQDSGRERREGRAKRSRKVMVRIGGLVQLLHIFKFTKIQ